MKLSKGLLYSSNLAFIKGESKKRARGKRESDNQTRDSGLGVKQRDRVGIHVHVYVVSQHGITPPRPATLRTDGGY